MSNDSLKITLKAGGKKKSIRCKRPSWKSVYCGYPARYDQDYFEVLKKFFAKDIKDIKSIKISAKSEQQPNVFFDSILNHYYKDELNEEQASAARVSIAITISPMMKSLFNTGRATETINKNVVARVEKGLLAEKEHYFITDVETLKNWLSKDDVWGEPDKIIRPKNGLSEMRKDENMKNKKGVCIISKPGKSHATLWKDNNVISGGKYIDKDCTIYFWELIGSDMSIVCDYFESKICGLHTKPPVLCKHHEARGRGSNLTQSNSTEVIEEPTYNSLDEAAMAAANIIRFCMLIDGEVEYGIAIYKNEEEEECDKFHLTQTRKGTDRAIALDDKIGEEKEKLIGADKVKCRLVNGKLYRFMAHVHSHPTIRPKLYGGNVSDEEYQRLVATEFSFDDYLNYCELNSYGYLVTNEGGWVLKRFMLPINDAGNIDTSSVGDYRIAFRSGANPTNRQNRLRDIVERGLLRKIAIRPVDENWKEISEENWEITSTTLI